MAVLKLDSANKAVIHQPSSQNGNVIGKLKHDVFSIMYSFTCTGMWPIFTSQDG